MPRVTKAELERRSSLLAESAELKRRADTLRAEVKAIEEKAEADLRASGRDSITRGGYRVTFGEKNGSVAWKGAFVAELGAEAAAKLQADAPKKSVLEISPPLNQAGK